jgi:hypothetical protein
MTRPPLGRRSFLTLSGAGLAAPGLAACSVPPGVRDFASRKIGMVLAANVFNVGSMVGPLAQFKILGIDPGGGTSTLFQKLPFVWGSRALAPNDTFPIGLQYMTATMPEARKITLLTTNSGDFSAECTGDEARARDEWWEVF